MIRDLRGREDVYWVVSEAASYKKCDTAGV